jgi:hypothetical protein
LLVLLLKLTSRERRTATPKSSSSLDLTDIKAFGLAANHYEERNTRYALASGSHSKLCAARASGLARNALNSRADSPTAALSTLAQLSQHAHGDTLSCFR